MCQLKVLPDTLVPFMASRGVEMILGILGIIRAGAGYVPLDLHWPDDRLEDVLKQCKSKAQVERLTARYACSSNSLPQIYGKFTPILWVINPPI